MAGLRLVNSLSRVTGRGSGTVAGGNVGLALCPDLLAQLSRDRTIILVSGTNGKTTTTAMVARGWGGAVSTNATGSNMSAGHIAALAGSPDEHCVLEVDEGWLGEVLAQTRPRVVVLLNLSRDQLDRANEVRQMAERWRRSLGEVERDDLVVVANANDPLVVYAARGARHVRWCDVPQQWLDDARSCPVCTSPLTHRGRDWYCSCGFAKPDNVTTVLDGELRIDDVVVGVDLALPGEFNRSNAAMALSALHQVGVEMRDAATRINGLAIVAGRFGLRQWRSQRIRMLLAKNPAGFTAILSTVQEAPRDVWIAINARVADGHDPSWLYDVPFEQLRGHLVWCWGERRLDLATRLEYAGVDFRVVDDESSVTLGDVPVSLMANYTAFSDWMARSTPC